MARKRIQVNDTAQVRLNGVSIQNQILSVWYPCMMNGSRPSKGKKSYKSDLTHLELRFEDTKFLKDNKLSNFSKIYWTPKQIKAFATEVKGK